MDYMLPRMLLRLKQMVGRLIRTPSDKGLVVIVEARCDKRYHERLNDSLPPRAQHMRARLEDLPAIVDEFVNS